MKITDKKLANRNQFPYIPHNEKNIGLPVAFKASRMVEYSTTAGIPAVLRQVSIFK